MNTKAFLLAALDAEAEHKKEAYKTLYGVRSFVDRLPENHLIFLVINREQRIKRQAEEIMRFLWLLKRQSINTIEIEHTVA